MGDPLAKVLLYEIASSKTCPLKVLNISKNNLGFKTGAYLMTLLIAKKKTRLRKVDLSYNTISDLVQNSIDKLFSELVTLNDTAT